MSTLVRAGAAVIGAAILLTAAPAFAAPGSFADCDGYGSPTDNGDGMAEPANTGPLGMFVPLGTSGNTRGNTPRMGNFGIAACDAALADPRLKPKHGLRRVSLIRARAMHRLHLKDYDGALADLDLAHQTGLALDDFYYRRSVAVGIDLIRAMALRDKGDMKGAEASALAAWEKRPYSREVVASAMMAVGPNASPALRNRLTERGAQLTPTAIDYLYGRAIDEGRFADALLFYPHLTADRKRDIRYGDATGMARQGIDNEATATLFSVDRAASRAYLLAALGRREESKEQMVRAWKTLNDAINTPYTKKKGNAPDPNYAYYRQTADRTSAQGKVRLERWQRVIDMRLMIADGKIDDFFKAMETNKLSVDGFGRDLLIAIEAKLTNPVEKARAREALKTLERRMAKEEPSTIADMFGTLPEAETAKRVANYGTQNFLFGNGDGFNKGIARPDGSFIVMYTGKRSSGAIVEELALFRAADLTRQAGKTGFVIRDRTDLQRTVTTTYYSTPLRSDPDGYEVWLDVMPVDKDNPPAPYTDARWRIIDAEAVYRDFAPIYAPKAKKKK